MGNGSQKHGDAVADRSRDEFDKNRRERDLSLERLRIRAEMRSSSEEEDTGVIEMRAREAIKSESPPPAAKGVVAVLNAVKTPAQAIVAIGIIAAIVVLLLHGVKIWP